MPKSTSYSSDSPARTLILSMRNLESRVSRSSVNEFEDCICSWEEADLLAIPHQTKTWDKKIVNNLSRKYFQITGNSKIINPINNHFSLDKTYEVFFYICQSYVDLLYLNSIKDWRKFCSKAVCLLDTVWMNNDFKHHSQLSLLNKFDCIFINSSFVIEAIANKIEKPCYYLATGVDAVEFSPYPLPQQRSIDACNFGTRSHFLHQALLNLAERENFFYVYDTRKEIFAGNHQSRRVMHQNIVKRTNYFIAHKARFNSLGEAFPPQELDANFFEGAAGGAVILGIPPQIETFRQNFDWTDAIIELADNGANVVEAIADLNLQPERLKEIRKNNVINSLLRHDWVYRWEQILDKIKMPPTPKMAQRQAYLQSLADMAAQKSS